MLTSVTLNQQWTESKRTNKYTIPCLFFSCLIQTASVFKLSNLLLKFEATEYFWLWCEIRHSTSKWGCVMISEVCFPFCTSYVVAGFGPISVLVNIGEVRGSVYFNNWAIQNNFFLKCRGSKETPQPQIQCQPDTWQNRESAWCAWELWQGFSVGTGQ